MSNATNKNNAEANEIVVDNFLSPLKLGESLQISPLSETSGQARYFVKYLGGLDKTSLICTLPTVDDKLLLVKENASYSASLFSGKNIYRFNTIIEAVFSRPYPHMHLKFPREIFTNVLRKNQRISTNIIASMRNKTNTSFADKLLTGRIVDLSMGGLMLETRAPIGIIDDIIDCSFKVDIEEQTVTFVIPSSICKIIEPSDKDTTSSYKYGIKFNDIAIQNKIMLRSYIFQSLTGEKLDEI